MNIANIFGLHLGCRIKFKQSSSDNYTGIGHLSAVKNGWVEISVDPDDTRLWYDCSDCKLLLKPLSKITDEDKAEFMEKFYPADSIFWRYMRIVGFAGSRLNVYSTRRQESNSVAYTYQQALFLSTKGYKVDGIVPDEYCEVEE
jgi:hypothetical protein